MELNPKQKLVGQRHSKDKHWMKTIFSVLLMVVIDSASAFQLTNLNPTKHHGRQKFLGIHSFQPELLVNNLHQTSLKMSTLDPPPGETNLKKILSTIYSKLPPPPEDQISMAGDIACLFLYTMIDHFVNKIYDQYLNSPETINTFSASAAIESASAASSDISTNIVGNEMVANSLPVWFDASASAPFGNIPLTSALPLEHHIIYSPAIAMYGTASVLLCSAWLISGYFTGAFQFKNSLMSSPNKAVIVTAKTWVLSSLIMFGIAYGSDSLVGCVDCLHKSVGVTKADADFIFGSLSVVMMWRFILSSFFGSDE